MATSFKTMSTENNFKQLPVLSTLLALVCALGTAVLEMLTWQLLDHTPNVNHCSTRPDRLLTPALALRLQLTCVSPTYHQQDALHS